VRRYEARLTRHDHVQEHAGDLLVTKFFGGNLASSRVRLITEVFGLVWDSY
jgi:hypothetical protein